MQVSVRDNNVDQALRALKKKLQREGVFREMKLRQHFEKPSVKKAREKAGTDHFSLRKAARSALSWFKRGLRLLLRVAASNAPLPPFFPPLRL